MMYDELSKRLRASCESCKLWDGYKCCLKGECSAQKSLQAADSIEELQKDLERSKDFEAFWQHEAEEALKKFQVAISNKPRWIPVTEQLPELHKIVLVADKANDIGMGTLEPLWDGTVWVVPFEDVDNEFRPITHWMPLPQPPEEE